MKRLLFAGLFLLSAGLLLGGCSASSNKYETETYVPASSSDRVQTGEVPADGSRKIPVVQQY